MPEQRPEPQPPPIDYAALQRFVERRQQPDAPLTPEEYDGYDRLVGRPEPQAAGALFRPFRY